MKLKVSDKDKAKREQILSGPLLPVLMNVALPLMMYNGLNSLFHIFDTMMAASISSTVVSSVAFLSQVRFMISAVGAAISLSAGMLIARHFGANDLLKVKQYVNTSIVIMFGFSGVILFGIFIFSKPLLQLLGMPEDLINEGLMYFRFQIINIFILFMNMIYIAIEKAKGNTKRIFIWNLLVMFTKLISTLFFVLVLKKGVVWLAFSSILSQSVLMIIGTSLLLKNKDVFGFSKEHIVLNKEIVSPMFKLALPIFVEKFVFSLGKVVVNSMSVVYGSLAVGALGISNNMGGLVTTPMIGVQEAEASVVSQNYGKGQVKRGKKTLFYSICVNIMFGLIGTSILFIFMDPIISVFSRGDASFGALIKKIVRYEALAVPLLGISGSCMGYLYGMGKTRITLLINMVRLLGYRIPVLFVLIQFTSIGVEAIGYAMMISNSLIGITALLAVVSVMKGIGGDFEVYTDEK